jgi:two-component system response regulator YesN
MWTVILVEDESYVREALKELIPWEEQGFRIVGEADNGADALELVCRHQLDLVITDIIMPYMDGVELLRQAREQHAEARFVMLTCMNEFDYVKQALEYGASGYMLKLSLSEETMQEMLVKLNKELRQQEEQRRLRLQPWYAQLWSSLYGDSSDVPPGQTGEPLSRFHGWDCTILAVLEGHDDFHGQLDETWARLFRKVARSRLHRFSTLGITTYFCWHRREEGRWKPEPLPIGAPCSYMADVSMERLAEGWRAALQALAGAWYGISRTDSAKPYSLTAASLAHGAAYSKPSFWMLEKEASLHFELRNEALCRQDVEALFTLAARERAPLPLVKEMALRLGVQFYRVAEQKVPPLPELVEASSHEVLCQAVLTRMKKCLDDWVNRDDGYTDHSTINRIIDFIKTQYYKDIAVKDVAAMMNIDENYLTKLFKKKTGTSMIHYIQKLRIEHAKAFLAKTDLTVSEVAERVGFFNDNYFCKIFKRYTGESPGAYKRKAAANNPDLF